MDLLKVLMLVAVASGYRLGAQPLTQVSTQCAAFSCPTANFSWPSNSTCVLFNTINFVRPCTLPATPFCNATSGLCQPAPANNITTDPAWPGEKCNATIPCQYGTCNNTVCIGVLAGSNCTIHDQCDPGLYCGAGDKCIPQIANLGTGCRSEFDCANNALCNMTTSSTNGTCYTVGSVGLGKVVTDCSGGVSHMCQTGVCTPTNPVKKIGFCSAAVLTVEKQPQNCTSDTDCVGTDSSNYFLSKCQCGVNALGHGYCQPFLGDPPGVQMIATWRSALAAARMCNTARRTSDGCLKNAKVYQGVFLAVYYYENYAQLQMNDDCIKRAFFNDYWMIPSFGQLLALTALILVL